eukprot:scaffold250610_cov30-Tisochrysis_lutea.AAC.1
MFTPTTRAVLHSLFCTARKPSCAATMPEEQAVSIAKHGPWRPSANDTRPAATEQVDAVAA